MELVVGELRDVRAVACGQFIPYPAALRQKCDLWLGDPLEWVIGSGRGCPNVRD